MVTLQLVLTEDQHAHLMELCVDEFNYALKRGDSETRVEKLREIVSLLDNAKHLATNHLYVKQDGADFYLYDDSNCLLYNSAVSAPMHVGDFDMKAATLANQWFRENYPQHVFYKDKEQEA